MKQLNNLILIIKSFFKKNYLIILILIIATGLRLINIDAPLQIDEAWLGYEGFSLKQTGHSMMGLKYPIALPFNFSNQILAGESILTYLMIFFIKSFGLSEAIIKLPLIICSILTILILYRLIILINNKKTALITSALYSISLWPIITSQTAFSAFLLPFLYILGTYLLILGIKKQKPLFFLLSALPWSLTFYSFAAAALWTPFLLLVFFIIFYQQFKSQKIILLSFVVLFFIFTLPYGLVLLKSYWPTTFNINLPFVTIPTFTNSRFNQVSINTNHSAIMIPLAFVFNYLLHLVLVFFFVEPKAILPFYHGLLELYLLPFILMGLIHLWQNKNQAFYKILLIIFFAYPLLPSLIDSVPTIHPTRDIMILPWIFIIAAVGLKTFWEKFKKNKKVLIVSGFLISLNIVISLFIYFTKYHQFNFPTNQYDNKQLINYLKTVENQYDKIIIRTDRSYLDLQYYNLAFYLAYDPAKLQTDLAKYKFNKLGKYEWQLNSEPLIIQPNTLYVFNYRVQPKIQFLKKFYSPNGQTVFSVASFAKNR